MKKAVGWVVIASLTMFWTSVLFQRFVQEMYGFGLSELTLGQLFGELVILVFPTVLAGFALAICTLLGLILLYLFVLWMAPCIKTSVEWICSCVVEALNIDDIG